MTSTTYPIVRNKPIAKFRYRGESHKSPVRRTVVITEITPKCFTGYEVREGNEVRDLEDAQVKSYRRDEIVDLQRMPFSEGNW